MPNSDELLKKIEFKYSYPSAVTAKAKTSVSELAKGDNRGYDFSAAPAFLSKSGLTPAERGTATHKFMQFANYALAAESIEDELLRLKEEHYLTEAEAEAVEIHKLKKFFTGELFARMSEAELHREMRFITELPVGEDAYDATVLQGVVDCVIDEGDSLSVIDFKTDRVANEEELITRYADQLSIYADACTKIFSRPIKERIIYSFHLGKTIIL